MRWTLAGLVWIAACYAPAIAVDVPCADNGRCPEGQTCSEGFCRVGAPADAGDGRDTVSGADRDGDGVSDATDNCPEDSNPDQGDEDGDNVGNACDLCPQLAGGAIADGDGDRIGDACDPNRGTADIGWLFEGFGAGFPGWLGSGGWRSVDGGIEVTASATEYLALPLTRSSRTFDHYSTAITVAIQPLGSGAFLETGIAYFDEDTDNVVSCELGEENGRRVLLLNDESAPNELNEQRDYGWTNGAPFVLRLVRHGAMYTCDVSGPSGALTVMGNSPAVPRSGQGTEVFAFGATVRLDSVSVVGPPP